MHLHKPVDSLDPWPTASRVYQTSLKRSVDKVWLKADKNHQRKETLKAEKDKAIK